MNDQDVLSVVRDGLSTIDMDTRAETLIAAGNVRRRRRRLSGVAAGVVLAAGFGAVGVPALLSHSSPGTTPASEPAQLAAFTLVANTDRSDTLTLPKSRTLDPDALQRALADAGIPAVVRVGSFCHSQSEPPGLDQVLTSEKREDGTVVLVITPSAIPSGAKLTIGFKPLSDPGTKDRVQFGLTWSTAPQICETFG